MTEQKQVDPSTEDTAVAKGTEKTNSEMQSHRDFGSVAAPATKKVDLGTLQQGPGVVSNNDQEPADESKEDADRKKRHAANQAAEFDRVNAQKPAQDDDTSDTYQ